MTYFILKVTTFFSLLKLRHLTTPLLSVELKPYGGYLAVWILSTEPLWLRSSISNCYQPRRIPSHTSPFLFMPVSQISLWKLKHQFWNSTFGCKLEARLHPSLTEMRWENKWASLDSISLSGTLSWQSDSSSLSTDIPRVQKAGETEPSQHCARVWKRAPRTSPHLHATLKLEESVASVSVILIAKCSRTILLPHWEALSLWWWTCLQWEGSVLCRFHSTA